MCGKQSDFKMFANDEFGKNIRDFKKSSRTMNLEKIIHDFKEMFANDEFGKNIRDFKKIFVVRKHFFPYPRTIFVVREHIFKFIVCELF